MPANKFGKPIPDIPRNEFTFVNVFNPRESSADIARTVRAQATTYSHKDPTRKQRGRNKPRKPKFVEGSESRDTDVSSSAAQETEAADTIPLPASNSNHAEVVSGAASRLMRAIEMPVGGSKADPFATFPVPFQPWFDWVLDYYRWCHLPPGIAIVQRSAEEGEAYMEWHMREAMSEPCFFYMQLLNAATPLVRTGRLSHDLVTWLRGQIVSSLNEAIRDSCRMLSIAVLLTVASIALHERLFGDARNALEIHAPAFSRMMSLKGGIQSLEVPRIGFVLLKFTDDVLSSTNSELSTGDLLNRWAPSELRKRQARYD